jgi:hypothetical protein
MGYGIASYAVPLARGRSRLGSKDDGLLKILRRKYAQRLKEDRQWRREATVSLNRALGHLIRGRSPHPDYHFQYVYAFELLCDHFGTRLSDGGWSGCPRLGEWAEYVDEALTSAGVPSSKLSIVSHLMDRGLPPGFPPVAIDDYPAAGYLIGSELDVAERALAAADLAPLRESEVGEAVDTLVCWINTCRKKKRTLVCFGY